MRISLLIEGYNRSGYSLHRRSKYAARVPSNNTFLLLFRITKAFSSVRLFPSKVRQFSRASAALLLMD